MSKASSKKAVRVLYLDNDEERVKTIRRILEKIAPNLKLVSASSIEDDLNELTNENYDCILTNYSITKEEWNNIGKMNGSLETPIILFHSIVNSERLEEGQNLSETEALDKRLNEYQVLAEHIQDIVLKHKEKLQINESERKLRSILNNMLEGCQVIDPDYRYAYLNKVAIIHSQKSRDELIGKTMMECYPGIENTEMFKNLTICLKEREPRSMENLFTYPDGSTAWFELRFEPIPAGVFILSLDITPRILAEQKLFEKERLLVEERARAENALHIETMMTDFIRNATHEIRTPLTSISGYLELIKSDVGEIDDKLGQYLDVIERNTLRLEKLTAELLDIQKLNSNRIELTISEFMVKTLIDDVHLEVEPILNKRNQRLVLLGEDALIKGDYIRLMQVLVNLIMNASRFSPDSVEIFVKVEKDEKDVTISVIDTGVGIEEKDIEKLFTPFPGIHVEGVSPGNGLGLSICKGIINLHDGEIWAESKGLGEGVTFSFKLPKA